MGFNIRISESLNEGSAGAGAIDGDLREGWVLDFLAPDFLVHPDAL